MPRPTTATIHGDALRHNLAEIRRRAPSSRVMAVVKADAYGHGLERAGRALADADAFGVAMIEDARRLRTLGLTQPILLLAGFNAASDLPEVRSLRLDVAVHHSSQLEILEQDGGHDPIRCWLKVDSGMHRLGFPPGQVRDAHARLSALPGVDSEIVLMNHFASSDDFGGEQTRAQMRVFHDCTAGLPGPRSLANSAAILGWPESHGDWVRPGGALYGMSVVAGRTGQDFGLQPAMTLATALLAVNDVCRGESIGYSGTWRCPEDMRVGIAAAGYGDGYPRLAPSGTPVLLAGRPGALAGRVSMDLMAIDLRGHPAAKPGDPLVLWGGALPVETVAAAAGTIGYDLTCAVTQRVRKVEA